MQLDSFISYNEALIDERDQGIADLGQQISDVHEMFQACPDKQWKGCRSRLCICGSIALMTNACRAIYIAAQCLPIASQPFQGKTSQSSIAWAVRCLSSCVCCRTLRCL